MNYFEEYDDDSELADEDMYDDTEPIEKDGEEDEYDDDFDDDDDEEYEVDMDDFDLGQLGDDDLDFSDDEEYEDEDEDDDDGLDSDVLDAISDDDNSSMEDKVADDATTPEEELTPDEKREAADQIATAVPAMLIKTEMDANESVDFFSGDECSIALDEGLLTEEVIDFFMDEVRNYDPDAVTTEATTYGNKTIVRFSKQALIARIRGICVVKCARAHRDPDIPKYAKACKQRRFLKARMKKKYGHEADKQARLIIRRMKQSKSPAIKKLSDKVSGSGASEAKK